MWGNNSKSSSSQQTGDCPGSKSVPMTVGRYLKSQREEQGQGVAEVAGMLRIHSAYLQAIDDNEIDKLPGPTYAVGFVRAYAEHLGLDGAKVVERLFHGAKVSSTRITQIVFGMGKRVDNWLVGGDLAIEDTKRVGRCTALTITAQLGHTVTQRVDERRTKSRTAGRTAH